MPDAAPPQIRHAITLPSRLDRGLLGVAVLAVSTSAPLIAATAAPALAIAFWRNAMATSVLLPWAAWRRRAELRALDRRGWSMSVWAGVLLAAHFATWVPSVTLTTVASATAMVSGQPVWAALLARARGHRVTPGVWLGIALAVLGVVLLTGADVHLSGRAAAGDLLALAGGALAAAYVTAGGSVRARVSTTTYTTICYGSTAALLLTLCLAAGIPVSGYPASAWVKLVALTAGAQLLGHSLVNVALRSASPTMVSLAILFEMPLAAAIAAVWLRQYPSPWAVPGIVLLLAGVAVVIRRGVSDAASAATAAAAT